jgi:hypothetical protein
MKETMDKKKLTDGQKRLIDRPEKIEWWAKRD